MKYPEYDSPLKMTMSDITTRIARNLEEMCWQAVQRVGIDVDKEKLLMALRQDSERYREAYANGYNTGYEKRDDDIVRCKDCKHCEYPESEKEWCKKGHLHGNAETWFCADGEHK